MRIREVLKLGRKPPNRQIGTALPLSDRWDRKPSNSRFLHSPIPNSCIHQSPIFAFTNPRFLHSPIPDFCIHQFPIFAFTNPRFLHSPIPRFLHSPIPGICIHPLLKLFFPLTSPSIPSNLHQSNSIFSHSILIFLFPRFHYFSIFFLSRCLSLPLPSIYFLFPSIFFLFLFDPSLSPQLYSFSPQSLLFSRIHAVFSCGHATL